MMRLAAQIACWTSARRVGRRGGLAVREQLRLRPGDDLHVGGVRRAERLAADDHLLRHGRRPRRRSPASAEAGIAATAMAARMHVGRCAESHSDQISIVRLRG